ncbi:MAG: GHMP kinase [Oligoflexia bacterium]|nr:GHMP kinase [Oligoflexia bacterium]MBF0366224.1 GHMP kinase [Oligoflexia bacterium]
MSEKLRYYGHGKLLITAEYVVLDGALALALPTTVGQSMEVSTRASTISQLNWKSYTRENRLWFFASFRINDFYDFDIVETNSPKHALYLQKLLQEARGLNPHFLELTSGKKVESDVSMKLEFPLEWGLGASSTLIYTLAKWAKVDPQALLAKSVGGSGYDLACAEANSPILYDRSEGGPLWKEVALDYPFKNNLFFVYSGQKQSSADAIKWYSLQKEKDITLIERVTAITRAIVKCERLVEFEALLREHEELLADFLGRERVKDLSFRDYWGEVKSLGAWGGDFLLVTSDRSVEETQDYFRGKGLGVFISFAELVRYGRGCE